MPPEPPDKPVLNYSPPPPASPQLQSEVKKLLALSLIFIGLSLAGIGLVFGRRELWILAIPFVGYGIVIRFGFWFA